MPIVLFSGEDQGVLSTLQGIPNVAEVITEPFNAALLGRQIARLVQEHRPPQD